MIKSILLATQARLATLANYLSIICNPLSIVIIVALLAGSKSKFSHWVIPGLYFLQPLVLKKNHSNFSPIGQLSGYDTRAHKTRAVERKHPVDFVEVYTKQSTVTAIGIQYAAILTTHVNYPRGDSIKGIATTTK